MQSANKNVFQNATLRLSIMYLLIIAAICVIFNFVILITISQVGDPEIDKFPDISQNLNRSFDNETARKIISSRDKQARDQLGFSLYLLDFFILTAGGFGSYWLAKRTLAPIEESHDLQAQFVSDASHELKTPLAAIQLETEMILRENSPKKADLVEVLESNLEESKALSSLTEMLLKLPQANETLAKTAVNLNEIVQERVKKSSNEKIEFSATKTFLAHTNETAVDELTAILIDNALKYRIGEDEIEVKIFRKNRQAVLEVTNVSNEISKENLDRLFDRFFRVDQARTRSDKSGGHGLGLAIAKKIVESIDSSLSVRNEKYIAKNQIQFKTTFSVGFQFVK